MTRSDFLTLAIVGLCLAALVFLIYRFMNIEEDKGLRPNQPNQTEVVEDVYDSGGEDPYAYDDTTGAAGDLGYGAKEIVTEVPAEAPAPKETTPAPEKVPAPETAPQVVQSTGDYLVLAGSFRIKSHAETEVRRLKKMGYTHAELSLFNRGTYASVLVDRYTNARQAEALVADLQKDGVTAYVHKKRTDR